MGLYFCLCSPARDKTPEERRGGRDAGGHIRMRGLPLQRAIPLAEKRRRDRNEREVPDRGSGQTAPTEDHEHQPRRLCRVHLCLRKRQSLRHAYCQP